MDFLISIFIYLTVLGLSCGIQDLVPRPGIKSRSPALGVWCLSHWTTREVSPWIFLNPWAPLANSTVSQIHMLLTSPGVNLHTFSCMQIKFLQISYDFPPASNKISELYSLLIKVDFQHFSLKFLCLLPSSLTAKPYLENENPDQGNINSFYSLNSPGQINKPTDTLRRLPFGKDTKYHHLRASLMAQW